MPAYTARRPRPCRRLTSPRRAARLVGRADGHADFVLSSRAARRERARRVVGRPGSSARLLCVGAILAYQHPGVTSVHGTTITTRRAGAEPGRGCSRNCVVPVRGAPTRRLKPRRRWWTRSCRPWRPIRTTSAGSPAGPGSPRPSPQLWSTHSESVLDQYWEDDCSSLGQLIPYADDFVILRRTESGAR